MTRASFGCNIGKCQEETETMKALETDGEVEALTGVLCPEEISEWKQWSDQPPPPPPYFFQSRSSTKKPSPLQSFLICISLLYTFFLLISAPSLCSEAKQKEEKHSARTNISLYVHLTYKNFNFENNLCRLLNTASDSSVTIVFSSIITNLKDSETGL